MTIVIAAFLLVAVLGAARWFVSGDISMLVKIARYGLMGMAILALGLLFASGRLAPFFIGVLACLPLIGPFQNLWKETKHTWGKAGGKESAFDSMNDTDRVRALNILGISHDSSIDEIKASHKKLIQKLHPDKGGSAYLTQEINHARDILLENFMKNSN